MSSSDYTYEESIGSSLIEIIVPTQQIASLENHRKEKLYIPHRPRVKRSITTHRNDAVRLDRSGKCTADKSALYLSTNRTQLQSAEVENNATCSRCNAPINQSDSGKIKILDDQNIPLVTSHGDIEPVTTSFYKKPIFPYKLINKEAGDATFGSFKSLHISKWFKLNFSKLIRNKFRPPDEDFLRKYTVGICTEMPTNEGMCNMREARTGDFPISIHRFPMPEVDVPSNTEPGSDASGRCCGNMGHCCKLACGIFGCKCKCNLGCKGNCFPAYPAQTISLNVLERAHLQNLYNTPCSSVQFSLCNCEVQDAVVKDHTTAAHYFAHKGLRQMDHCGRAGRSVYSASSYSNTEYRSQ